MKKPLTRTLHIGERVFYANFEDTSLSGYCTILDINDSTKDVKISVDDVDTIVSLKNENSGVLYVDTAAHVYQIADGMMSADGFVVCYEHLSIIDYDYYCPDTDDSLYEFEVVKGDASIVPLYEMSDSGLMMLSKLTDQSMFFDGSIVRKHISSMSMDGDFYIGLVGLKCEILKELTKRYFDKQ